MISRCAALVLGVMTASVNTSFQPPNSCGKREVVPGRFQLVDGWTVDEPCSTFIDRSIFRSGTASARITHGPEVGNPGQGSTYILQRVIAASYRGRRVAYTAFVRTADVKTRAQLTFGITADSPPMDLGRDQMDDRFLTGTRDWKKHELVLDVPDRAWTLVIGVELEGTGSVWVDDAELRIVPTTTPSTVAENGMRHFMNDPALSEAMIERRRAVQKATSVPSPTNLGFEK
jgi:hypothetical protein